MPARSLALVAALSLATAPLPAQLVTNGGFETPLVPVGSFTLFNSGGSFAGWSVIGAPGNVGIVSTTFTQFGFAFPTRSGSGNQWLDLTGLSSNHATGVQQTVATVPGTRYDLSFWVGNIADGGGFGTTSAVNVFVNGVALAPATSGATGGVRTQGWERFTRSFTAAGALTTLAFVNGDATNDNSNGLDDVALVEAASTVPEPATSALVGAGLLALTAGLRRRARRGRAGA